MPLFNIELKVLSGNIYSLHRSHITTGCRILVKVGNDDSGTAKGKTKAVMEFSAPEWNESLHFNQVEQGIPIKVSMVHWKEMRRNYQVGEAILSWDELEKAIGGRSSLTLTLTKPDKPGKKRAIVDLEFSLLPVIAVEGITRSNTMPLLVVPKNGSRRLSPSKQRNASLGNESEFTPGSFSVTRSGSGTIQEPPPVSATSSAPATLSTSLSIPSPRARVSQRRFSGMEVRESVSNEDMTPLNEKQCALAVASMREERRNLSDMSAKRGFTQSIRGRRQRKRLRQKASSQVKKNDEFHKLFHLDGDVSNDLLLLDVACSFIKKGQPVLAHGRLFLSEQHLCLYATMFDKQMVEVVAMENLSELQKVSDETDGTGLVVKTRASAGAGAALTFYINLDEGDKVYGMLAVLWQESKSSDAAVEKSLEDGEEDEEDEAEDEAEEESDEPDQGLRELLGSPDKVNTLLLECDFPCSVNDFFKHFLSDETDFSRRVHKSLQSKDLKASAWAQCPTMGMVREISYQTKFWSTVFSEKPLSVAQTERYRRTTDSLVLETVTRYSGVKMVDRFQRDTKWEVKPVAAEQCKVTVHCGIVFTKSTIAPLRGKCKSDVFRSTKQRLETWVKEARLFLENRTSSPRPTPSSSPVLSPSPNPAVSSHAITKPPASSSPRPTTPTPTPSTTSPSSPPQKEPGVNVFYLVVGVLTLLLALLLVPTMSHVGGQMADTEEVLSDLREDLLELLL